MALLRPWSKSTNVSAGQKLLVDLLACDQFPRSFQKHDGESERADLGSLTLRPCLRNSPARMSASKDPNRKIRQRRYPRHSAHDRVTRTPRECVRVPKPRERPTTPSDYDLAGDIRWTKAWVPRDCVFCRNSAKTILMNRSVSKRNTLNPEFHATWDSHAAARNANQLGPRNTMAQIYLGVTY